MSATRSQIKVIILYSLFPDASASGSIHAPPHLGDYSLLGGGALGKRRPSQGYVTWITSGTCARFPALGSALRRLVCKIGFPQPNGWRCSACRLYSTPNDASDASRDGASM